MPRYFFDTDDGQKHSQDEKGLDLGGPWEARALALAVIPDILRDVQFDDDRRDIVSSVRDENGRLLYTAALSLEGGWQIEPPPKR